MTVLATARRHEVDPVAYLAWLLPQFARRDWSDEQILAHLLPASFQQALERSGQRGAGGDSSHTNEP